MAYKKKVLIPNGNYSEWALVNAAHRLGLYVIVSGLNEDAPANQFADEYVKADYSDKEAMLALAMDKKIDYMVTNAHDDGMLSTAYVCEKLGLPGHDSYETTWTIHHKDTIKPIMQRLGLHTPYSEIFSDRQQAIEYIKKSDKRMIVKPSDNVASRGVGSPKTKDEIERVVDEAFSKSKAKVVIVEPFITGFFAPVTSMIIDKKVVAFFADAGFRYPEGKKHAPEYPMLKRNNGGMKPCPYMDEFAPSIIEDFNKLAQELNMVDGKLHCELMITPEHEAYIYDLHRRMSGFDEPWPEWNLTTGLHWEDWIVRAECGMDLSDFPVGIKQNRYFHYRNIYAPKNGIIKRMEFDEFLTSHLYPKHEEKKFFMYDLIVSDHEYQPLISAEVDVNKVDARGNQMLFEFDTEEECEFYSNPENSDEFYKHITFEYEN